METVIPSVAAATTSATAEPAKKSKVLLFSALGGALIIGILAVRAMTKPKTSTKSGTADPGNGGTGTKNTGGGAAKANTSSGGSGASSSSGGSGASSSSSVSNNNLSGAWVDPENHTIHIQDNGLDSGTMLDHPMFPNTTFQWTSPNTFLWTAAGGETMPDGSTTQGIGTISSDFNTITFDNGGTWERISSGSTSSADGSASSGAIGEYMIPGHRSKFVDTYKTYSASGTPGINDSWYDTSYNLIHVVNGLPVDHPNANQRNIPIQVSGNSVNWGGTKGVVSASGDSIIWGRSGKWTRANASPRPSASTIGAFKAFKAGNKSLHAQLVRAHVVDNSGTVNLHR